MSSAVMTSSETMVMQQSSEVITTSMTTVKKSHSLHRKKSKKEEKNISVKSSSEKVKKKMKSNEGSIMLEANPNCQACGKAVYAMERVKAEKLSWHKECFRCKECNKPLSVESFQSHLSSVYCKPHFKQLFAPKAVEEDEQEKRKLKKPQLIICESTPKELPPDVARASDKTDLGLEELSALDVKSRFQMFENGPKEPEPKPIEHPLARDKSSTLLSKLAKFKSKGMDIGVSDEYLNGIPIEASSSEGEDEEDEDAVLKKSKKHTSQREQPVSFCNMSEIVGKFESGEVQASRNSERKQEIQSIRSRLFMGKQAKIKEMYQQSVAQSEQSVTSAEKIARELQLEGEKASSLKEKFENGDIFKDEENQKKEIVDESVFNVGISKQSRSIFKEIDANIMNSGPLQPPPKNMEPKRKEKPFVPKDVVRATDQVDDVKIETSDISNKFKFFETYQPKEVRKQFRMTPPRDTDKRQSPEQEVYRDPTIIRSDEDTTASGTNIAQQRHTASRMISVFKQMEEERDKDESKGPKPLKCFTPPPPGADYHAPSSSEEEYGSEEEEYSDEYTDEEYEENVNVKRYSTEDEALKQAQAVARAKSLRSRFENWADNDNKIPQSASVIFEQSNGDDQSQIESAKSLRKKFETMGSVTSNVVKTLSTTKVNRFV